MDFHSLTRRELQALCKKNKIPANTTNVAMADALKALEIVEGMEEFLQASQSETAQSTVDSMDELEMTSPYVPPSGVRSTRRRQAAKQEPVTVNRTRQATQKKSAKKVPEPQDCAIEAQALMKEDLLKECVENEKKEVLMTPAPSGATGRRRRVKENNTVEIVYSTRRSVRLAGKNVTISNIEHEVSSSKNAKKKLPTAIGFLNADMKVEEDIGDSEDIFGVTGVDTSTNSLENSEEYDMEVVSAKNQGSSVTEEIKLGASSEEEKKSHFEVEADAPEKMETPSEEEKKSYSEVDVPEQKMVSGDVANEEVTELGDQNSQRVSVPLNLNHEIEGSGEGEEEKRESPFEAVDPEQEMKESPEKNSGIGKTSDNTPGPCESMDILLSLNEEAGTGPNSEVAMDDAQSDKVDSEPNLNDDTGMAFSTESEPFVEESDKIDVPSSESEVAPLNLNDEAATRIDTEAEKTEDLMGGAYMTCEVQQCSGPKDDCAIITDTGIENMDGLKGSEGNAAEVFNSIIFQNESNAAEVFNNIVFQNEVVEFSCNTETKEEMYEDREIVPEGVPHLDEALEQLTELKLQQTTQEVSAGTGDADFTDPVDVPTELNQEEPVDIGTFGNEEIAKPEVDLGPQDGKQAKDEAAAAQVIGMDDEPKNPQIPLGQETVNSMSKRTKNDGGLVVVFIDNKENIGSGCKLVIKEQKAKNAAANIAEKNESLDGLSFRKLKKMLKELSINSNDGPGNHQGNKGLSRSALQILPEDDE